MTAWTGAAAAHLESRQPFKLRWALRSLPKTFEGVETHVHLWTGVRPQSLTLGGVTATYAPVGDALGIDPIRYRVGTEIGSLGLTLPLTAEGETFARGLDTRMAETWLWALLYHPETNVLLGSRRYWKG